ncbi:unnamed protein product [Tetraodon nigroviridis]|uniref:(spotted green pufferfish) hypothetical protein n=1 Tax=Tetraodon nigroviridis TaxID=99883 RepID=Q4SCS0_TETNG|nr:unnamed protein product [Tetraodon nigroviridis]
MSLSRNGTLEKRDHSERGTPSRGSGVVVPPPYSPGGGEAADPPLELRGSLDCWACSVLVTVQNMIIALINAGLASVVFGTILTPALIMIVFGFLCHSTVRTLVCWFSHMEHLCTAPTCWMTPAAWLCSWWASCCSLLFWSWRSLRTVAWPDTSSWACALFPTAAPSTRTSPPRVAGALV